MVQSRVRVLWISLGVIAGCGKGGGNEAPPPTAGGSAVAPAPSTSPTPKPTPTTPAQAAAITYPSPGVGPAEGFDLAALRTKLTGTWLVGGAAFSSIPTVWSLAGDTLTQIDAQGTRSTSVLRLLAPCYLYAAAPDGSSGTYGHFVFDGDALYLGLGIAGVTSGDRTVACMSAATYVLDHGTCTRWTKRPFTQRGGRPEDEWEREVGVCGYDDAHATFHADDKTSKRPIYGVEQLDVQGGVLLTKQMAGNRAERMPSLEAALARQHELLAAAEALTRTPTDLPFSAWGVASTDPNLAAGTWVWMAGVTRDHQWSLGVQRYQRFDSGVVQATGMTDTWAPSAFVHPADGPKLAPGDAVLLGQGAMLRYGRVTALAGDQVTVAARSGNRTDAKPIEARRALPIAPGAWTFGAPLACKDGAAWVACQLVLAQGDDAFVLARAGVKKVAKAELRLIDVGKRWGKGATVWALPDSGMGTLVFVEAKIRDVTSDGVLYQLEGDGRVFSQTFDKIIGRL